MYGLLYEGHFFCLNFMGYVEKIEKMNRELQG